MILHNITIDDLKILPQERVVSLYNYGWILEELWDKYIDLWNKDITKTCWMSFDGNLHYNYMTFDELP